MDPVVTKMEEESFYENDHAELPPSDIVAYNELRSCADLFRMHQQKILEIQPEFQRRGHRVRHIPYIDVRIVRAAVCTSIFAGLV